MEAVITVRMDSAMKDSGAAAMKKCGYTPSQAVRKLFQYAAAHGSLPFDAEDAGNLSKAEKHRRLRALEEFHTKEPLEMTDEQIREARLRDRHAFTD